MYHLYCLTASFFSSPWTRFASWPCRIWPHWPPWRGQMWPLASHRKWPLEIISLTVPTFKAFAWTFWFQRMHVPLRKIAPIWVALNVVVWVLQQSILMQMVLWLCLSMLQWQNPMMNVESRVAQHAPHIRAVSVPWCKRTSKRWMRATAFCGNIPRREARMPSR